MSESVPPSSVRSGMLVAGKYRIDALLGEGGMGTVWAATHVELGQQVALKLIASELARSEDLLARFRSEAKAAAALQSRYVVRMYDIGVTADGRPYIAMEYLQGESLEDRINRVGSLSLTATVRIISQVCKALKQAHSQSIVHRDLKPANIFLATSGDDEEVAKVLDFGIAKFSQRETDYGATATGIILGTPLYMSPEQARALKTLDHRSDLYSLGMVTYRMLIGDPPFAGESFGDLVYSICTKPLPSMHERNPTLPPALDAWFQTACAKEANDRYRSADEMSAALVTAAGLSGSHFSHTDPGGFANSGMGGGFHGASGVGSVGLSAAGGSSAGISGSHNPASGLPWAPGSNPGSNSHSTARSPGVATGEPKRSDVTTVAEGTTGPNVQSTTGGTSVALVPTRTRKPMWSLLAAACVTTLGALALGYFFWFAPWLRATELEASADALRAETPPPVPPAPTTETVGLAPTAAAQTAQSSGASPADTALSAGAPSATTSGAPDVAVVPSAEPDTGRGADAITPRKKGPAQGSGKVPDKPDAVSEPAKPVPDHGKSGTPDMGF
jgi:eukaryotic-like serine/threonine-protein kinase